MKRGRKAGFHLTEEHKRKLSKALTGRKLSLQAREKMKERICSKETRRKISEKNKNVVHTPEWNKKVSESLKGKALSQETKDKIRKKAIGRKHIPMSKKARNRLSKKRWGKNNPNWKGGFKREIHKGGKYKHWRINVFKRDNFTCQSCQKRGCEINAHHIKSWRYYTRLRYNLDNGITLCAECHKLIHKNEKDFNKAKIKN